MPRFSTISDNNSSTIISTFKDIFDRFNFVKIAKKLRIEIRHRKFSFGEFIPLVFSKLCEHQKEHVLSLEELRLEYQRLFNVEISNKPFHNALDKEGVEQIPQELASNLLQQLSKHFKKSRHYRNSTELIKQMCKLFGVNDVILIDGTEIALRYSCALNFECKGKGRKQKDDADSDTKPGLKLHVAYSLTKQTIEYITITEACGSERDEVLFDKFKNCLFIMDRGYVSSKLEKDIAASGNYFLIKDKKNTAGTIIKAFNKAGDALTKCLGKKISSLKEAYTAEEYLDFDIETKQGHNVRVIRAKSSDRDGNTGFVYLRTNLKRGVISCFQLHQLYRTRWTVELFMKALKTGNSLQAINSSKKHIILFFVIMSVVTSLIKTYIGLLTLQDNPSIKALSMLKLHSCCIFKEFFRKACFVKKTVFYEQLKKVKDFISSNCQRTKPSARDALKLKDMILLVNSIIHNKPITTLEA